MRLYISILLTALITTAVVRPATVKAEPLPAVRLTFDKHFYSRGESFTATGTVANSSSETFRYTRLTLAVFPALEPGSPLAGVFEDPQAPIIRQNWFEVIGPGSTVTTFKRDIGALGLDEGVYPAELTLTLADRRTVSDRTYLVVMEPKDRQMPVAVVWNLHQPERRLPDGTFFDNALAGMVSDKPNEAGLLSRQLAVLSEHPTVKANLAASPILLEQLSSMAGGYRWREGSATQAAGKESEPAAAANRWLEALKNTMAGGQAEILTSPYGQAPLPALAALGWRADALKQLELGKAASQTILTLEQPPTGLYLPGLLIDKRSAEWLVQTKVRFAVAQVTQSSSGRPAARPLPPLNLKTGRGRLTVFQSDSEITDWLGSVSAEKAEAELTALLAQRLLAGSPDDIVMIASDRPPSLPGEEVLREIYKTLSQTVWVKTISLSSALDRRVVAVELKAARSAKIKEKKYELKLRRGRKDLSDFAAAAAPTNELRQRLERQFYVAESIDYLLEGGEGAPPIGKTNVDSVSRTVDREFAKLELAPPPKITFSTRNGKIPVVVINRTGYPLKVRLRLTGKDFVFSDDKIEQVTLTPKENLISYDITAGFMGVSNLKVTVLAGNRVINSRDVEVRVSSLLRYLVVTATTLSILAVAAVIFIRGKRR